MSKRAPRQPLYDLLRSGPRSAATPARPSDEERPIPAPPLDDPGQSWLAPGKVIRLPVGYLLVAITVVCVLVIAAYVLGHRQGAAASKAEFEEQFISSTASGNRPLIGMEDPLNDLSRSGRPFGVQEPTEAAGGGGNEDGTVSRGPAGTWGPIDSDPRQVDVAYFVLAETSPAGAERLAVFCREQGLETYLVSSKNTRFRQVIALPGFTGSRRHPPVRELETRIHAIGDLWQRREHGASSLRDAYPVTYR